jgi:trk system potassium uptake protein TrkA
MKIGKDKKKTQFAVLGLGRFGISVVKTLAEYDADILACDCNPAHLNEAADYATHLVQADASDEDAMRKLGLGNFDVVVLAMGDDFEATLIAAMLAKELGAGKVIAKAQGLRQKKILEGLCVDRVVVPELEAGVKVARNLMNPNVLDALEQANLTITEMTPDPEWIGKTVGELNIRRKEGYLIVAIQRGEDTLTAINADTEILQGDILITLLAKAGSF